MAQSVDDSDLEATELSEAESFSFLFTSLWDVDSGLRRMAVNIPDTILYKEGVPYRWLFTSEQTGEVLKKKDEKVVPSEILRSFKSRSRGLRGFKEVNCKLKIATVWYMTSRTTMASYLVDDVQLASLLREESVPEILALQVFMGGWPIKSTGIFEHRYWVRKNSSIRSETFELASVAHGQNISLFSHNMDRLLIGEAVHDSCAIVAKRVVKRLEFIARAKVANVVIQVVFNSSNFPFLVGVRGVFLWHPPLHFLENRSKFCFVAGVCPQLDAMRSAILPKRERERDLLPNRKTSGVGFDLDKNVGSGGGGGLNVQHQPMAEYDPSAGIEQGAWDAWDEEDEELRAAAEEKKQAATLAAAQEAVSAAKTGNLRASVDSEEPIEPYYAPAPKKRGLGDYTKDVDYSDQDLPFRSSKLELGRLNGAGRRPLSASATGVYFPMAGTAQTVHEAAAVTAAVGKSRRTSNLAAAVAENKNGRSSLDYVRRPAPQSGERRHCEQMTESLKTRLQYYQSQLKDAETLPIEKFLSLRRPITAPHASSSSSSSSGVKGGKKKLDLPMSARGINVPIGGHGLSQGGRRGTGFERKLPTQSGTVCFGDYCLLSYEDISFAQPRGHDFRAQAHELQAHSHESALQQLGLHKHDHEDGTSAGHALSQGSVGIVGGDAGSSSSIDASVAKGDGATLPPLKPAADTHATATAGAGAPEVFRRPDILPHQLPFRSVLLARSEESYNGSKLHEDNPLDIEVGELEAPELSGGSEGLTQLAKRHLQRVGRACLEVVRRGVHHDDAESYQEAWDSLNKVYRNQIYADALSKVHPSRFYFTVPLCDLCWKLYSLLDFYRERIVFGALNAELEQNARKRENNKARVRRSQSSPAFARSQGSNESQERKYEYQEDSCEEKNGEGGEAAGFGRGRPPRPSTSDRRRSDREGYADSEGVPTRVPKVYAERLSAGIAPLQQNRLHAAPLGNMLSASAGNHGGRTDKRDNVSGNDKRPQTSTRSSRKPLTSRPKSAAATRSSGSNTNSSRGGGAAIYRGEAESKEPPEEDDDGHFLQPFLPLFQTHAGGKQKNASSGGGYDFASFERTHFRFPANTPGHSITGGEPLLPFLTEIDPTPIFPIPSLDDITKSDYQQSQSQTLPVDLLDEGNYAYTTLPYTAAPFFPLPSSLSASHSIESFEYDTTMHMDSLGMLVEEAPPQDYERLLDILNQPSLEKSAASSKAKVDDLSRGYLGGLDVAKKISEISEVYGYTAPSLKLGMRQQNK